MPQHALRPSDVAVLLELAIEPEPSAVDSARNYRAIAARVGLSVGEAHNAVRRLRIARLVPNGSLQVRSRSAMEFLVHGVRFAFPAELGPVTRGVPTSASAPVLALRFTAPEQPTVWPSADGKVRGSEVVPLIASAPKMPELNPRLYECLALVDALRIGRARERKLAAELLSARIVQNVPE